MTCHCRACKAERHERLMFKLKGYGALAALAVVLLLASCIRCPDDGCPPIPYWSKHDD